MKIKIKNHEFNFICDIIIDVYTDTNISNFKENKKCFKNTDYDEINNITYSNLYDYFTVNNKRVITIELTYKKEPKEKELEFIVDGKEIICPKVSTKVTCNIPVVYLPELKRVHLYSYLSCFNLIDVGWLEINGIEKIYNIYSLINYDFNKISEIYDPWEIITEYNPAMINYYYWFSCFSYCEEIIIEQKECCTNILDKWDIVYLKEYGYKNGVLTMIIEKIYDMIEKKIKGKDPSPGRTDDPSISPTNRPSVRGTDSPSQRGTSSPDDSLLHKIANDIETLDKLNDIVKELINFQNGLLNGESVSLPSFINLNGKNRIPLKLDIKNTVVKLTQILYLYRFSIFKNDKYKKIVVSFPGLSMYYQLIDELYYEEMVDLPIVDGKQRYYVMTYYYNIFSEIEEDLFNELEPLANDEEYQVIFTGHSLGGAIATLASFYYNKKYKFTSENILITFGQPKVGSENFAKELTNIMKGQIYRIARPYDIATLFPIKETDIFFKGYKAAKIIIQFSQFVLKIASGNYFGAIKDAINFVAGFNDFKEANRVLLQKRTAADFFYSQTGGLYMINDETKRVYHCDDFYNEERNHPLCKNHHLKISLKIASEIITNFNQNRNYLTLDQNIMSGCQKGQKLSFFKLLKLSNIDWESILFSRRLEMNNNINHITDYNNRDKNNNKLIRKLNNIEDIITLKLFEEINFNKYKYELCFKYETTEKIKIENLFLIINTKNNYFFGEICLTQNIAWLNNEEYENVNCYFANTKNPFSLKIILKQAIVNEKELYIYVRGKTSGSLELYDLSKNKNLNISLSYIIPYLFDYPSENELNFILPIFEEDIYANIIIYDYEYNLVENITNITNLNYSTIFEIYKNKEKINYDNNKIILKIIVNILLNIIQIRINS